MINPVHILIVAAAACAGFAITVFSFAGAVAAAWWAVGVGAWALAVSAILLFFQGCREPT
jgi:hypothetical protein